MKRDCAYKTKLEDDRCEHCSGDQEQLMFCAVSKELDVLSKSLGVDREKVRALEELIDPPIVNAHPRRFRDVSPKLRGSWHGGLHSDDIALNILVFEKHGLSKGLDYDYCIEDDEYHWDFFYDPDDPKVRKAFKHLDLIRDLELVRMFAYEELRKCAGKGGDFSDEKNLKQAISRAANIVKLHRKAGSMLVCPKCNNFSFSSSAHFEWKDEDILHFEKRFSCGHVVEEDVNVTEGDVFDQKGRANTLGGCATTNKVKQLVVFAILMESWNGIVEKAPSYILEKYELAMQMQNPEQLLDRNNLAKFKKWCKTWE